MSYQFKSLGNLSAIQAEVSDHEPFVANGVLSANITTKMRGIAPNASGFPNNGFNKTEGTDQAYSLRLMQQTAPMLKEMAEDKSLAVDVIALQEVPAKNSQAYADFIQALKTQITQF